MLPVLAQTASAPTEDGTTLHLIIAGLTVIALVTIFRLVRQGVMKPKYSILWLSLGIALAVIASVPGLLDTVADSAGIEDATALLLMLGMALLLLLTIHFSYELSRTESRVRTLAEEVTLLKRRLDEDG